LADDFVAAIERRRIEASAEAATAASTQTFSVGDGASFAAARAQTFSAGHESFDGDGTSLERALDGEPHGAIRSRAPRSAKEALRLAARGRLDPDLESASGAMPVRFPFTVAVARSLAGQGRPVPAWVGLMALLEDYVATWDAAEPRRADTQAAILGRSGFRCAAPCCTSRSNLEIHHLLYRSHGGGNAAENLEPLCCLHHHRGEHGGLTSCVGRAPLGVIWRLGREDLAEWWRNERRLEME
jgi:hypothetical protein